MICGKAFCCCLLLNCIWFLLWDKFIGKRFRVHLAINTSIFDFELLRAKLKSTGICNLLVHYRYHQLITEYIIIDMMQYYYLRVSRRDVRRIGKLLVFLSPHRECIGRPIPSCAVFRSRSSSGREIHCHENLYKLRQTVSLFSSFYVTMVSKFNTDI